MKKILILLILYSLISMGSAYIISVTPSSGTDTDTWWNITGSKYIINVSGILDVNETVFNQTSALLMGAYYTIDESILNFVNRSDWTTNDNYPTPCVGSLYVQGLGDTLTCTDVNDTIDARIVSINHNVTWIETIGGTNASGNNIVNVQVLGDGLSWNVTEQVADPSVEILMNVTGVASFNQIIQYIWYTGGGGHVMSLYLWDYDDSSWERYYSTVGSTTWESVTVSVLDGSSHISGGVVRLNWSHTLEGAGSTGHIFRIDYTSLVSGYSGSTISDHDALANRDDLSKNHPWALRLNTNITANRDNLSYINPIITDIITAKACASGEFVNWTNGTAILCGTPAGGGASLWEINGDILSPIDDNNIKIQGNLHLNGSFINATNTDIDSTFMWTTADDNFSMIVMGGGIKAGLSKDHYAIINPTLP